MDATAKILTIDDSPTNQKLINRILSPDYVVIEAMSGAEGISKLSETKPELILLDVDMPGINGYDTCREIRTRREFEDTPILFVSCLTEPEDHLAGYRAGADDYINKPVDLEVLRAKVALNLTRLEKMRRTTQAFERPGRQMSHFLMRCLRARSTANVTEALEDVLDALELNYALRLHGDEIYTYSNLEHISSLEDVLLDQSQNYYPMLSSSRLILGSENIVLLLRNMHDLDAAQQDQLASDLGQMLEAAEERIQQLSK